MANMGIHGRLTWITPISFHILRGRRWSSGESRRLKVLKGDGRESRWKKKWSNGEDFWHPVLDTEQLAALGAEGVEKEGSGGENKGRSNLLEVGDGENSWKKLIWQRNPRGRECFSQQELTGNNSTRHGEANRPARENSQPPISKSRYSSPEHKLPENQQQKHGKAGNRGAKQQAPKECFSQQELTGNNSTRHGEANRPARENSQPPISKSRYSSPEHKLPENQQQKHGKAGNRGAKQQAPKDLRVVVLMALSIDYLVGLEFRVVRLKIKQGFEEMTAKKVDALEGKVEQIKYQIKKFSIIKGRFLAIENRMESLFGGLEEMMRKLMEMQSKTPPAEKEIEREEFDKESFKHQKPPPRAPIRDGSGFLDRGTVRSEFCGGGGGVDDHYERHFGQGEWITEDGGGRAEPWGSDHARRVEERWDSHPRYIGEIWRDHDNHYTGGERSYRGGSDLKVRKLKMRMIEEKKSESSISDTQAPSEDKLIDKEKNVNEEDKEINLQSQADGTDQNLTLVQIGSTETSTSQEHVFSKSKNHHGKDTKTKPTSENERKQVEAPLVSTGMEMLRLRHKRQLIQCCQRTVDNKLIKPKDSNDEIQLEKGTGSMSPRHPHDIKIPPPRPK
ncbi:hypothetical protein M5K25_023685 [Dendrobium thyrsiflorum]|uniref:Uncharacterized protein n=1 Tax=Dendrobium thyrsiflorum TaxID=117978 RepID=A0ABD0U0C5_DENTH